MDKFFLNDVLIEIRDRYFDGNEYQLAKHVGFISNKGKVLPQSINRWCNKKVVLGPESLFNILQKTRKYIDISLK